MKMAGVRKYLQWCRLANVTILFMADGPVNMIKFIVASVLLLSFVTISQAAQSDWGKDWEQTLAAAKKEGQVNVYIYRYEGLLQDFKREFPGINVVSVTGRGNDLTNRIMAERRAGRFIADV